MDYLYTTCKNSLMIIPVTKPFLSFQSKKNQISKAIQRVLNSENYILGTEVELFEKEFAEYIGTKRAVGVANGTDAIEISLRALEIGNGDEVITVSHTAVGTITAIEASGASPVLVDVEQDYFTLDPNKLEEVLSEKTKAIVVVHLYGFSADITKISEICKKYNLFLIEDVSQAHGAKYKNKKLGSIGDVGCFSCYPTKNLGAIGDAGIVTTNNNELADKIKMIREYGWKNRISILYGRNSRLDEIQAAILRIKLKYLDDDNNKRIKIAKHYFNKISKKNIQLPIIRKDTHAVFHLFVIQIDNRDNFKNYLEEKNIQTGIHYPIPVHKQPAFNNKLKTSNDMSITDKLSCRVISLPMFPELNIDKVNKVCETINKYE